MIATLFEKLPWWRLTKFVLTGGVALFIDVAIYFALTRFGGLFYLVARVISLGVAIIWSFTVNRQWTFRATYGDIWKQAVRFLVVILSTSLLSLALMHVGVALLYYNDLVVLLAVAVLTTLINFLAHQFWSYASGDQRKSGYIG